MTHDIRILSPDEARRRTDELADVLHDCVEGGASVSFMWPFEKHEARAFYHAQIESAAQGKTRILAAFENGRIVGTVMLGLDGPCNQRHRADVKKLLVHRAARNRGVAEALMHAAEDAARGQGLILLVLDTVTGSTAERLYARLGWQRTGVIPNYAKWPDGRFCDTTVFFKPI